jgi:hypothetical protein
MTPMPGPPCGAAAANQIEGAIELPRVRRPKQLADDE